ncbi:TetR/AcrR family transcriptional regulator [Virgisporangium aurantiacum]|uniref:Transcriptional regulator n=1 Tax=Virgisporangium aurantiacum TaxID=175570 RepID=A0A8J3ZGL8_9ACTN|nr:TetR/AcrR family transcriptional regulator [Virgisporangium aurantiacum]GIJ63784.1 transcriptional regulator [Virgisporangium aurantiacum]
MSPQRSNRSELIEGTLRCIERLPPERVTARAIADESGANLASITYHFGSKDELVTEAVITGLDRWLAEIVRRLDELQTRAPEDRFQAAFAIVAHTRRRHEGLARTFLGAMAKASHDERVRQLLTEGFRRTRGEVATALGLGTDAAGRDAAGLALALFNGLLFQSLVDPGLAIEGRRMTRAQTRLRSVMPPHE